MPHLSISRSLACAASTAATVALRASSSCVCSASDPEPRSALTRATAASSSWSAAFLAAASWGLCLQCACKQVFVLSRSWHSCSKARPRACWGMSVVAFPRVQHWHANASSQESHSCSDRHHGKLLAMCGLYTMLTAFSWALPRCLALRSASLAAFAAAALSWDT